MTHIDRLPLHCNHWGTYRVEARNGNLVALHPFERDPKPSPIAGGILDVLNSESRVIMPMFRKGWLEKGPGETNQQRGSDCFVELPWSEAVELVAEELGRVRQAHGNSAIFGGSYGWASAGRFHHAPSQLKRFLNCIGGYTSRRNSYSLAAAEVVLPHILAPLFQLLDDSASWASIEEHADLIVAFGGIPVRNSQINSGGVSRHTTEVGLERTLRSGTKLVSISPIRSDSPVRSNSEWIPLRPGTDTALLLGIAHTLLTEELVDRGFLRKYSVGFERFSHYLLGNSDGIAKTAEWASEICDVSDLRIGQLARRMANSRTLISVSWSLTRQDHGEQPYWAAVAVAAMLGQIGLPGRGIGFGYGAVNLVGDGAPTIPAKSLSKKSNQVSQYIPVARISDMLLHPGQAYQFNGSTRRYPFIDLIYWAGGNPFHHHQDINRLRRAWKRPSTIIINEWCWNATAKHADIVLPCTTSLERNDIAISRSPFVVFSKKVAEPPENCLNDYDIFRALAERMGVQRVFTEGKTESGWLEELYSETREKAASVGIRLPEFNQLRDTGWFEVEPTSSRTTVLEEFRRDPDECPLRTPSGRIEIYSEAIAGFGYNDCVGHPNWFEPYERLGSGNSVYPLHLISNQPHAKLHSQLDHGNYSRSMKIEGREPVLINHSDAEFRNIQDGDFVRVFNDRGSCIGAAVRTNEVMQSVVQMSTGAWYDPLDPEVEGSPCKHGNPNILTRDKGTSSLAQGPTAHTCLVEVELLEGMAPAISAFDPPRIIRSPEWRNVQSQRNSKGV